MPLALVANAEAEGMHIDCVPFIDIEAVIDPKLQERIAVLATEPATVAFTSANAVKALYEEYLQPLGLSPRWQVHCLQVGTQQAVTELLPGCNIITTAPTGEELANNMLTVPGLQQVAFFCGNIRRKELPTILRSNGIALEELVIYNNNATPQTIDSSKYQGILFYSPSAVKSFFSTNNINNTIACVAIGHTTANAIQEFTTNTVLIAEEPSAGKMIETIFNFLKNNREA